MKAAELSARIYEKIPFETIFIAIFLVSLFLRLWSLDLKLFHHDEAVHAWFSYRLLHEGFYVYDPSYHGPFLYYATAAMFQLFGDSDLVGRILPALFGASLTLMVYGIYRLGYLDKTQTLIASLFIAISPDLVYFSRFLRHDIFQLAFTLVLVVALLYYARTSKVQYAMMGAVAAALGMCCKEDMPITLLIFFSYGVYLLWQKKVQLPSTWKRDVGVSCSLFFFIILLFYSSFGSHPDILITGAFSAIEHWTAMSSQCRICGPWFFYIILMILYELPILILAIIGTVQFLGKSEGTLLSIGWFKKHCRILRKEPSLAELVERSSRQLKRDAKRDRREEFFRFFIYWMILSMAAYAYIGEKVPWLIIHQILPMIFVATYAMTPKKAIFAVVASVFLILCTWHVAFVPSDVNEPIVQVQNSEDLRTVMALIDSADHVVIASSNYWPLPWYYRGEKGAKLAYYGKKLDESAVLSLNADLIITYDVESYESLPGYEKQTYKLNYWFSFSDNEDRLLEYFIKRDGTMGSMNIDVFIRARPTGSSVGIQKPPQ